VDGTWNVPTTIGGRHMEFAYYFDFCRLCRSRTAAKQTGILPTVTHQLENQYYREIRL